MTNLSDMRTFFGLAFALLALALTGCKGPFLDGQGDPCSKDDPCPSGLTCLEWENGAKSTCEIPCKTLGAQETECPEAQECTDDVGPGLTCYPLPG